MSQGIFLHLFISTSYLVVHFIICLMHIISTFHSILSSNGGKSQGTKSAHTHREEQQLNMNTRFANEMYIQTKHTNWP